QHSASRRSDIAGSFDILHEVPDRCVEVDAILRQRELNLRHCRVRLGILERLVAKARRSLGREIAAEHDVLTRLRDWTSIGRLENVVRRQHEQTALELGLERKRNVHGHLVTVEVSVERGADERVNTNGLSFDEYRLESLDAESVKGRSAVQQPVLIAYARLVCFI